MPFLFIYVIFQSSSLLQESVMIFTYISWVCEPGAFLDVRSIVVAAIADSRLWAYPSSLYVSAFFDSKFLSRTYTNSFGFILVFVVQSMYLYLIFFLLYWSGIDDTYQLARRQWLRCWRSHRSRRTPLLCRKVLMTSHSLSFSLSLYIIIFNFCFTLRVCDEIYLHLNAFV